MLGYDSLLRRTSSGSKTAACAENINYRDARLCTSSSNALRPGGPLKSVAGEGRRSNCILLTSEGHVAVCLCRLVGGQMQVIPGWSPDLRTVHAA